MNKMPEQMEKLPVLDVGNLDLKELYKVVGNECRRCHGTGIDPEGEYFCMLCRGERIERHLKSRLVCKKHPDKELVAIGRRYLQWEDAMGFDRDGYMEVKGCPVCKIPVLSDR